MPSPIIAHLEFVTNCKTYIINYSLIDKNIKSLFFISNGNKRMFGTIAEIFEHSAEIETSQILHIKAMGHQRFVILQVNKFPGR